MARGRLHVGTSGWQYRHWGRGLFYPSGLKSGDWLPFFAERYSCVEINFSFYRIPTQSMVERWREITPDSFLFAVKAWRLLTHIKRLGNCDRELADFLEVMGHLGERRGPLLVQLPPSMKRDAKRLDAFLGKIELLSPAAWKVAVEFRNREWLNGEVLGVLDRHGAALCLADLGDLAIEEPNGGAGFVYVRRHGSRVGEGGNYLPEEIVADARRVDGWLDEGREVFVFYNNDAGGHALGNARELREAVGALERVSTNY